MLSNFTLWLFAISFGASALGGTLGMASGIFIVPLLSLFGGVDIHAAIGASLISVIACSCAGAATFLKERLTNIRLAIVLEVATTLGALTGVLLVGRVPTRFLFVLFAFILLASAWQMLQRRSDQPNANLRTSRWPALGSHYPDRASGREIPYEIQRLGLGMGFMYAAGLISALLGIGSGVLKIPAMDTALGLPIKVSTATSNFMIGVTAAASAGAYFARGDVSAPIAGPVALGSVVGAVLGARVLMRLPNQRLRLLFVAVLIALSLQMGLSAFGIKLTQGGR